MMILTIDTTGAKASAALIDEGGALSSRALLQEKNHLTGLTCLVGDLLKDRGLSIHDVTHIAVSQGPGSFTGIRIGVSTARALAQVMGAPVIGVPTLETFVYNLPAYRGVVCPLFDARRSQVYSGAYCLDDADRPAPLVTGAARDPEAFLTALEGIPAGGANGLSREIMFFGDGAAVYRDRIDAWARNHPRFHVRFAPAADSAQKASSAARLALHLAREGACLDHERLRPVYMRKAEAERRLEEKADFYIRAATPDDVDEMTALDQICFSLPWSRQDFEAEMTENALANYLVCRRNDRVIAYAGLWAIFSEGHITNVAVHPDFRRKGLGTALIRELTARLGAALGLVNFTLEVRESNEPAISLYEKMGFRPEGRRRGYYADTGEDALIMWRMGKTDAAFAPLNLCAGTRMEKDQI
jgi:tRNA threonylcarbamoyl adenosine modification protein YeaZ/ribosomal-protein-alanine acetyltransferase